MFRSGENPLNFSIFRPLSSIWIRLRHQSPLKKSTPEMSCLHATRHTLSRVSSPVDFASLGPARLRVKPFKHAVRNVSACLRNTVTQPSANQRRAPGVTSLNGRVVYVHQQNDGSTTETLQTGNSPEGFCRKASVFITDLKKKQKTKSNFWGLFTGV